VTSVRKNAVMASLIALVIHPTIPPPPPPVSGAGGVVCGLGGDGACGLVAQFGSSAGHGALLPVPPPSGRVPGASGAGVVSPPEGRGVVGASWPGGTGDGPGRGSGVGPV